MLNFSFLEIWDRSSIFKLNWVVKEVQHVLFVEGESVCNVCNHGRAEFGNLSDCLRNSLSWFLITLAIPYDLHHVFGFCFFLVIIKSRLGYGSLADFFLAGT